MSSDTEIERSRIKYSGANKQIFESTPTLTEEEESSSGSEFQSESKKRGPQESVHEELNEN